MKQVIIFLLLIFLSCNTGNKTKNKAPETKAINKENTKQVSIKDTLTIKMDDNIPYPKGNFYRNYVRDKNFSFLVPSDEKIQLYLFDLINKKWEIKSFPMEGPNGIIKYGYYKIFNNSSMAYFPYGINKVLILDNDKITGKYDFIPNTTLPFGKKFESFKNSDYLIFPSIDMNAFIEFNNFGKKKLMTKVDLKTHKKERIMDVPDDFYNYHSRTAYDVSPEAVFPNDSTIVFIMRKSPNIYVYNNKTRIQKKYHYPNEKIHYSQKDINLAHKNTQYMFKKGFYHSIYYDDKHQKYYRLSEFRDNNDIKKSPFNKVRVDIFDRNFNLLGSNDFSGLKANYAFISDDGLYILSTKIPDENTLIFYKISI